MELSIPLSKKSEPLFRQVYKGLRKAILSGEFPTGGPPYCAARILPLGNSSNIRPRHRILRPQ
jgi:hypothetical protein